MKQQNEPRTLPLSIRLTREERASLTAQAGDLSLGAFIRATLLGEQAGVRMDKTHLPERPDALLARILSLLGQSGIAANLNTLARHADAGSLLFDPETEKRVRQACEAMLAMRLLLLHALGVKGSQESARAALALSGTGKVEPPEDQP